MDFQLSTYAFLLGNHPTLSVAELLAVLPEAKIKMVNEESIILELEGGHDAQGLLDSLGGTIKIYAIGKESQNKPFQISQIEEILRNFLENNWNQGKLSFAVNLFGEKNSQLQKSIILGAKKYLREKDISCRFVNKEFKNTNSVQSFHEKLATKGIELGVFMDHGNIFIGKLVANQNIESYGDRDYGRPERNMKIGLMPPKLAQILINLTGLPQGKTLYDPFCGTGGIITEGLLMGYEFYGSDINSQVLQQADRNIHWILDQRRDIKTTPRIFLQDASKLDKLSFPFDGIVTENYLGPVISKELSPEEFLKMEEHLEKIYLPFFEQLLGHVSASTPIVFCLPVFFSGTSATSLVKTLAKILGLGYTASALIPEDIVGRYHLKVTEQNSIIYHRENQMVGREIFRIYKK